MVIAPQQEAADEILSRINDSAADYILASPAVRVPSLVDTVADDNGVCIRVCQSRSIDAEWVITEDSPTTQEVDIVITSNIEENTKQEDFNRLELLTEQIRRWVKDHDSLDGRVQVMSCTRVRTSGPDGQSQATIPRYRAVLRASVVVSA